MLPRLAIRGGPACGESLKGLMLRLAWENRYGGIGWILDLAGLSTSFAAQPCDLTRLATIIGAAVQDLEALTSWPIRNRPGFVHFGSGAMSPSMLDLVHPKICPECIIEGGVARRLWDIRIAIACSSHRRLLVDACPYCNRRLSWLRPALAVCRCGKSLSDAPRASAPPEVLSLMRLIERLAAGDSVSTGAGEEGVSLDTAARLVWFFGTTEARPENARNDAWRSLFMSKPSVAYALPIVERGAPILLDWPSGLFAWLAGQRRPAAGTAGLLAEFGPLLRRLRSCLRGPEFAFVFDAIRCWLASEWDGGFVKPWSFFYTKPLKPARHISGAAAARELGVAQASVAAMIARGDLRGQSRRVGRRHRHVVDAEGLIATRQHWAALLSKGEVAAELGTSTFQVEALHARGLLTGVVRPRQGIGFEPGSLWFLMARLWRHSRVEIGTGSVVDSLALSGIPKSRFVRLVDLLDRIFTGRVALYRSDTVDELSTLPVFARFWVKRADILGYRIRSQGEGVCLSVREAAKRLRIAVRMIPALVRAGCLDAGDDAASALRLGKCRVTAASVEAFSSRYRLSSALAAAYGTSTRRVVAQLGKAGLIPAVSTDTRRGISAVWRLADLEGAGLQNIFGAKLAP